MRLGLLPLSLEKEISKYEKKSECVWTENPFSTVTDEALQHC